MSASYRESQPELEELRNAYLRAIAEINAALPRSEAPGAESDDDDSLVPPPHRAAEPDDSDGDTMVAEDAPIDTPPLGARIIRTRGGHLVRQTAIGLSPSLLPESAAEGPWIRREPRARIGAAITDRIFNDLGVGSVSLESVRAALERAIDNESVPGAIVNPYVALLPRTDGLGQGFSIVLADETQSAIDDDLRPLDSFGLARDVALDFLANSYILTTGAGNASAGEFEAAKQREHDLYDTMVGFIIK